MGTQEAEIVAKFCDRFEGREQETGCEPIVVGELLMVANEMNMPMREVAAVLLAVLRKERGR